MVVSAWLWRLMPKGGQTEVAGIFIRMADGSMWGSMQWNGLKKVESLGAGRDSFDQYGL